MWGGAQPPTPNAKTTNPKAEIAACVCALFVTLFSMCLKAPARPVIAALLDSCPFHVSSVRSGTGALLAHQTDSETHCSQCSVAWYGTAPT